MDNLRFKLGRDWTIDDLNYLVENEIPESVWLELKQSLPLKGGASGWQKSRKLHQSEREGIAKEVCALSNAYGGKIVVGITESTNAPKRASSLATSLPEVQCLAERLSSSLSSIIDPPISGLDVIAILDSDNSQSGYLVIDVPQSVSAPHGHGEPAKAYIRRNDRSEPMTMRDLQNTFWEMRSLRERIEQELTRQKEQLEFDELPEGNIGFRFIAISEFTLNLTNIATSIKNGNVIADGALTSRIGPPSIVEMPSNIYRWRPTSKGVDYKCSENSSTGHGRWEIDETGILSVAGYFPPLPNRAGNECYVGWIAKTAGLLLGLTEIISKYAELDNRWILTGGIRSDSPVQMLQKQNGFNDQNSDFVGCSFFRAMPFSSSPSTEEIEAFSAKIWETCHLHSNDTEPVKNGIKEILQLLKTD